MVVPTSAQSRPAPHFRGAHPAGLVPQRSRCRGPAADPVDLPGASRSPLDVLVPVGRTGTAGAGRAASGVLAGSDDTMSAIAPTLQGFFTERLVKQRRVSPRTIASYRDSLKLLFVFVQQRTGKTPAALDWADLDVEVIGAFLEHLETDRHNGPRTRNLRLTAIRSLFAYAALRHPEHADSSSGCSPSPPNGSTSSWCRFSPRYRSTPSSTRPTVAGGKAAATARCCCWRCRPGFGSPS